MTDGTSVPSRPTSTHSQSAIGVQASAVLWNTACHRSWLGVLWLLLVLILAACASGPKLVNHAFSFSAGTESPRYEVLAYRYGDGKGVSRSSDNAIRQYGSSNQWTSINGPMPLGNSLYVKWRDKDADQTYEDVVDLLPLLPRDMTNQEIHFVVDGPQLYIYLIDPVPRPKDWPVVGPKKFQNEKIRQIYPR